MITAQGLVNVDVDVLFLTFGSNSTAATVAVLVIVYGVAGAMTLILTNAMAPAGREPKLHTTFNPNQVQFP